MFKNLCIISKQLNFYLLFKTWLSRSGLARQMLFVSTGRVLGFGFTFLTNIIIVKYLGPAEYGVFIIGLSLMLLLTGIIGEALDFGLLKFVPVYLQQNENKVRQIVSVIFKLKLFLGAFLLIISLFWGTLISKLLFKDPGQYEMVFLSILGLIGILMMRSVSTYLQATESFKTFLIIELSHALLKFTAIILVLYLGFLNSWSSLFIFAFVPFLVFLWGTKLIPKGYLWKPRAQKNIFLEIIHFSKFIVLSFGLSAIHSRLDIFMLGIIRNPEEVGIYSAALTLAMIPEIAASFAATVLYPKIMPYYNTGILKSFFLKSIKYTIPLCIVAIIGASYLAGYFINLFYSKQYTSSIPILQILISGYIFWWVVIPIAAPFLVMVYPSLVVWIDLATIIFIAAANGIVIPQYGPEGAAWVNLFAKIVIGSVVLLFTFKRLESQAPTSNGFEHKISESLT